MKKLPIGIQYFDELIKENYVYIDKTRYIYDLITTGKYYFFARPRRFGKSLLLSTLAAIFSGKKELFDGLAISSLPYEWKKYPVIIISFSDIPFAAPEELEEKIKNYLRFIAHQHNLNIDDNLSSGESLRKLILELSKIEKVTLLIDEYD